MFLECLLLKFQSILKETFVKYVCCLGLHVHYFRVHYCVYIYIH